MAPPDESAQATSISATCPPAFGHEERAHVIGHAAMIRGDGLIMCDVRRDRCKIGKIACALALARFRAALAFLVSHGKNCIRHPTSELRVVTKLLVQLCVVLKHRRHDTL